MTTHFHPFLVLFGAALWPAAERVDAAGPRPNVLFIAIDDLNDWVGVLGGHPQTVTPNIDRLAARGMLFTNAHCSASLCNPSRTSVLTGTLPSTNGVHGNEQDWRTSPHLQGHPTLPRTFREHGYWTGAAGKIFHANHGCECGALQGGHGGLSGFDDVPAWTERFPSQAQQIPKLPVMTGRNFNGLKIWHWDWGPIDVPEAETVDGQVVAWSVDGLRRRSQAAASQGPSGAEAGSHVGEGSEGTGNPFFLAVGLYATHGPWYSPTPYYDQFPREAVRLPVLNPADDLDDVPLIARRHVGSEFGDYHEQVTRRGVFAEAVRAYLAQIHFADAQLGRLLQGLEESGLSHQTVIMLWSDHGWHLGEKQKWHKGTNWEEGTRVPLIVVAPGVTAPGSQCDEPVSLVDLYPTLLELCGLPSQDGLDGESLMPQLRSPETPRIRPAYTVNGGQHQSVRSRKWRYIRYGDGSEELYDHDADPTEYRNVAADPQYAAVKQELAGWFPAAIRSARDDSGRPGEGGFRPIFNGYDLTSWEGDATRWRVEDGVIVGETTADRPLSSNTFLVWRGTRPDHFELRLQFRLLGNNNSGVQYRSQLRPDLGAWVVSGYQADLHAQRANFGMLYEEKGRGILAQRSQKVVLTADGRRMLVGQLPQDESPSSAPEEAVSLADWHELTIVAEGNHLIHRIDGQTTVEVWDHQPADRAFEGLLALQLHRGAPMRVEFRDLRLKDLSLRGVTPSAESSVPETAVELPFGRPGRPVSGPDRNRGTRD